MNKKFIIPFFFLIFGSVSAQEAQIRKTISERIPDFPKIVRIKKSEIQGLYELQTNNSIFYSNKNGDFLIRGDIINTKNKVNVTQEKIVNLNRIDFSKLPLRDSIAWIEGDGSRQIAVFSDPNCPHCKNFERELKKTKNVTVYNFLYPVLGSDSVEKSKLIWCSKERVLAWSEWMSKDIIPILTETPCDHDVIQRNLVLGDRLGISGTPTIVFEDGSVTPGSMQAADIEKKLAAAARKKMSRR